LEWDSDCEGGGLSEDLSVGGGEDVGEAPEVEVYEVGGVAF